MVVLLEAIGTLELRDDGRGSHRICQKTLEVITSPLQTAMLYRRIWVLGWPSELYTVRLLGGETEYLLNAGSGASTMVTGQVKQARTASEGRRAKPDTSGEAVPDWW